MYVDCRIHSSLNCELSRDSELRIVQKGETINRMKEQTGAHIEMNKNSPHDAPTKQFFIKGTPEQIKAAKDEIAKIVGDGGSKCYPYFLSSFTVLNCLYHPISNKLCYINFLTSWASISNTPWPSLPLLKA